MLCREVHSQKSRAYDVAILVPTTDAYEMGTQGEVGKNVEAIFTKTQHAAITGKHVHLGLACIHTACMCVYRYLLHTRLTFFVPGLQRQ